jgi:uncharacterized membrane protein YccF (DUF307 family)
MIASAMRTIGNVLWLVMGGLLMALAWWFVGALLFVSLVGIPWARSCFVIGQLALLPFGREAVSRRVVTGRPDIGTGLLGALGNIFWFVFAGLWLGLGHATAALVCALTIIGIPFAVQHVKLAGLAFSPVGKTIVRLDRLPMVAGRLVAWS